MKKKINMLWLGAAKRNSLYRMFVDASLQLGVDLRGYSLETSKYVPIGQHCEIIIGPRFNSAEFAPHLLDVIKSKNIHLILPFMDAATVALSAISAEVQALSCVPCVSSWDLCVKMEDKLKSEAWFDQHNIPRPGNTNYPLIAKPKLGFGARGQQILRDPLELESFARKNNIQDYIVQELMEGEEYTIDAYVNRAGKMMGAMSRRRVTVVGGEVESSIAEYDADIMSMVEKILALPGWLGPVTLQFFKLRDGSVKIVEINPRFGGGAPHSVYAGLPLPEWVISECLGLPMRKCPELKYGSFMTRYRSEVFYDTSH